jgi:hypothetical protein
MILACSPALALPKRQASTSEAVVPADNPHHRQDHHLFRYAPEHPLDRRGRRTSGPGPWLEKTIWADVRRFHSDPGAVLERVRDQLASDGTQAELEARHADKTDRLAAAHKERDRWLHLYAQGHLEEHELESHLADLRVHLDSLKVPVSSVEEELEAQHEHARVAETAEAWLMSLRERVEEIEDDSLESYKVRRQLVQLLVERIVVGRDENGDTSVRITYRFGPHEPPGTEEPFVTGVNNAFAPPTPTTRG